MLFTNTRQLEVADMSANCVFFGEKRQAKAITCQKKTQLLMLENVCAHIPNRLKSSVVTQIFSFLFFL